MQEDEYLVEGQTTAVFSLECSRCLKPLKIEKEIVFRDLYIKEGSDIEKYETQFSGNIFYIEDGNIDLNKSITAALEENRVFSALCSEECLGLCPVCGQNLNEKKCNCREENIDPRLEALKNFKF